MKKLFVLGTLLTIFLFLFGCQSESPVSPSENTGSVTSLQKPSLNFNVVYKQSVDSVICTWSSIGGAKSYQIWEELGNDQTERAEVQAVHGQKNYEKEIDVSTWGAGENYIELKAFRGNGSPIGNAQFGPIDIIHQ